MDLLFLDDPLVTARLEGGVANRLEVDQAQSLVASAQANAALLERLIGQTENLISFLVGRQPGPIARGKLLIEQYQPPEIPAGLPSALIDRRPDIREAEQRLVATNARIGVAKAAFFPSINLTAAAISPSICSECSTVQAPVTASTAW
jgi:outer membrane protein, multidrug efflux system